jgi:hypothetical protein
MCDDIIIIIDDNYTNTDIIIDVKNELVNANESFNNKTLAKYNAILLINEIYNNNNIIKYPYIIRDFVISIIFIIIIINIL